MQTSNLSIIFSTRGRPKSVWKERNVSTTHHVFNWLIEEECLELRAAEVNVADFMVEGLPWARVAAEELGAVARDAIEAAIDPDVGVRNPEEEGVNKLEAVEQEAGKDD